MDHPNAKKSRRGYRLNKKKFAGMLLAVGFVIVTCAVAVKVFEEAAAEAGAKGMGGYDAVAIGSGVPEKTDIPAQGLPEVSGAAANTKDPGKLFVVVDAGHGGFDPGAEGANGACEAKLNLEIAKRLKSELESRGAQVLMTRETDEDGLGANQQDSLKERRRIIQEHDPDMVVSIHMNSFGDPNVSGPLVLFAPGSETGKEFADTVQQALNEKLGTDGTARSQDLVVVKSTDKPSILVECGFITNAAEEKDLGDPDYQTNIAKTICDGIDAYLEQAQTAK
jgi:N-acetylmuramoyl-L-alanine amidase